MLNKVQVKYVRAMKVLEDVLDGKNTDVANRLVARYKARVEKAGEYVKEVNRADDR